MGLPVHIFMGLPIHILMGLPVHIFMGLIDSPPEIIEPCWLAESSLW
jgi:hypothetical protein